MLLKQTACGRQARSLCIVSELPLRLQEKKARDGKLAEAKIVRLGSVKLLVGLSATGELVIEIEPP
jgi:hypothetical protein